MDFLDEAPFAYQNQPGGQAEMIELSTNEQQQLQELAQANMLEQMHQKEMEENAAAMTAVEPSHPQ